MTTSRIAKSVTLIAFAFVGWAICGAIMGIGRAVTSLENTLVIHAIGAPIVFGALSFIYHSRCRYSTPLHTAFVFLGFVAGMDLFLIALFVEKNLAMFESLLGTWIPFALIFLSTYGVGLYVDKMITQPLRQGSRGTSL